MKNDLTLPNNDLTPLNYVNVNLILSFQGNYAFNVILPEFCGINFFDNSQQKDMQKLWNDVLNSSGYRTIPSFNSSQYPSSLYLSSFNTVPGNGENTLVQLGPRQIKIYANEPGYMGFYIGFMFGISNVDIVNGTVSMSVKALPATSLYEDQTVTGSPIVTAYTTPENKYEIIISPSFIYSNTNEFNSTSYQGGQLLTIPVNINQNA